MAKILSESCSESENCSQEMITQILTNCINSETESENYLNSYGSTTEFREEFLKNTF